MRTTFCDLLGIDLPIAQAPIGGAAVPALAAAVSNAGGLGSVNMTGFDGESARQRIRRTQELTPKPFCTNFILSYEGQFEEALEISLTEKVPVINFFWGDPALYVDRVHSAGSLLLIQVGSVEEACHAAECGVDIIVAQEWAAGGHVRGQVDTLPSLANILDEVKGVPVLGSGGIIDGRGLAAVLALGAAGANIGTRFLASEEASVAPEYLKQILNAKQADTVHTTLFDYGWSGAPHRVLRNSTYHSWVEADRPPKEHRPGKDDILATDTNGYQVRRYESITATADLEGNIEALALWAGQGVGIVNQVQPAAEIVHEIASDARHVIQKLAATLSD
jgi:nitronate monooxygenase